MNWRMITSCFILLALVCVLGYFPAMAYYQKVQEEQRAEALSLRNGAVGIFYFHGIRPDNSSYNPARTHRLLVQYAYRCYEWETDEGKTVWMSAKQCDDYVERRLVRMGFRYDWKYDEPLNEAQVLDHMAEAGMKYADIIDLDIYLPENLQTPERSGAPVLDTEYSYEFKFLGPACDERGLFRAELAGVVNYTGVANEEFRGGLHSMILEALNVTARNLPAGTDYKAFNEAFVDFIQPRTVNKIEDPEVSFSCLTPHGATEAGYNVWGRW